MGVIVLIPVWEFRYFTERGMWDLGCEKSKEGLACFVVVLCLSADEVEGLEGVDVITVSYCWVILVIL